LTGVTCNIYSDAMQKHASSSLENLLADVERFLKRSGMPATNFGVEVMKDRHLVRRLRRGAKVTLPTADRIHAFIKEWRMRNPRPNKRAEEARAA
jgi:hypothetical protein